MRDPALRESGSETTCYMWIGPVGLVKTYPFSTGWQRYGFALGIAALVASARWGLMPILGNKYPFVTMFPAVVVTALWAGFGAGMVMVGFSFALAYSFGFTSGIWFSFGTTTDRAAMIINLMGATFVCFVAASARRNRADLRSQQSRLEEIVARRTDELAQSNDLLRKEVDKRGEVEARLRAASVAKDTFIAALSHELRTPLNPVLMIATEAAGNAALPPEVRSDFDVIAKNIRLEARLIDDLLDVTRITHGKMSIERQIVEVDDVLREALAKVQGELDAKKIRLSLALNAPRHTVRGDASRLQQVFWNVFKNAAKFTPHGGEVFVQSTVSGANLVLTVRDTGIGMTEDEMRRVFSPFEQGDHALDPNGSQFSGLGLGLSIARTLVEHHAGTIEAESPGRNRGATFTITLPLAEKTAEETAAAAVMPKKTPPAMAKRSKILLVEDDQSSRTALARLLERRNYEVVSAGSAAEAWEAAEKNTFEFVVSDIGLPEEDGLSLMKRLRERHGLRGIALTGYGTQEDIASSEASGFIAHLTKPISVAVLEQAIVKLRSIEAPSR